VKADETTAAEVRAVLHEVFDAFVRDEIDTWMHHVTPVDELVWIGTGPPEFGRGFQPIREMVEASLVGTSHRSYEMTWEDVCSQGDVAWFTGEATISARAGGRDISLPFRYTGVLVRRDGRWLIANLHQSVPDVRQTGETWDSILDIVASEVQREQPPVIAQSAPDGMVTLLFSDIEASTELTDRLGDLRWIEVLREHNAIVRERVSAHGGVEVKTIGDAFMVAFQSARRAVLCAIDLQRAFSAYSDEHPESALRVRAGLHAGEPVREGDDFYGKSVILASRVAGEARGGEILASSLLKELVDSAGDIEFGEPRSAELKGLAGTHAMYPVVWER
jgi:class 3 adenylate cyclase/ketosteroid isomerase-like protein